MTSAENFRKKSSRIRAPIDCTPSKWGAYFDARDTYNSPTGFFNYYRRGITGPILICIHGAGYSGLTWALFADEISKKVECRIIAVDLRGHGNTETKNDENLSLDQLSLDVKNLVTNIFSNETAPVVLLGHSLGAAIAVAVAPLIPNVAGVIVIDLAELRAIESLPAMRGILSNRPKYFRTIQDAIQWNMQERSTQNIDAAKISMPGQIKNSRTNILASEEVQLGKAISVPSFASTMHSTILEDEIAEINPGPEPEGNYVWRIDLTKTDHFWREWFDGVSDKFLSLQFPKVLLMADITSVDTKLIVAQMQGKFQLQVLTRSGHAVHEDSPAEVAEVVANFLVRQKLTKPTNNSEINPEPPMPILISDPPKHEEHSTITFADVGHLTARPKSMDVAKPIPLLAPVAAAAVVTPPDVMEGSEIVYASDLASFHYNPVAAKQPKSTDVAKQPKPTDVAKQPKSTTVVHPATSLTSEIVNTSIAQSSNVTACDFIYSSETPSDDTSQADY